MAKQQQPQQRQPKPKTDSNSRLNGEGKPRSEAKPGSKAGEKGSKPAAATTAAAAAATGKPAASAPASKPTAAAARPAKQEGGAGAEGGKLAGKADRGAAKAGAGERQVKRDAGARPVKREKKEEQAGAGRAAGDKPSKPRAQQAQQAQRGQEAGAAAAAAITAAEGEAGSRPAKPTAPKSALAAVKAEAAQEHAGSNPTSLQREGGGPASAAAAQQQATSRAARQQDVKQGPRQEGRAGAAPPGQARTDAGTPVELLLSPADAAQPLGELVVAQYGGHSELWEALRARFAGGGCRPARRGCRRSTAAHHAHPGRPLVRALLPSCPTRPASLFGLADKLPGGTRARLVYQDSDGDWLLLQPEAPWRVFQRTVRKLVVSCRH